MATWYVRTTGSDSNAGTSAGSAFLTIGKAMTQASLAAGDTIYVGAGTYRITTTIAPTSMASMTYLYGDTDGSKTGDAGEVIVTNYGTDDTSAPTSVSLFTFASKSYWTIGRLTLMNGTTSVSVAVSGTSANLTFQDLTGLSRSGQLNLTVSNSGTPYNFVIERCRMLSMQERVVFLQMPSAASGSDFDANVAIRNSVLISATAVAVRSEVSGTATYKPGGMTVRNSFLMGLTSIDVFGTNSSTTYPVIVNNCVLIGVLSAAAANQMTEDYNFVSNNRTNVTAGANSVGPASRNYRFSLSHEAVFGGVTRPFGEFPAGSPLLTFGGTAVPTDDINGVTRPASGAGQSTTQQALGPYERANSATRETTTTRTGGTAIKIAGPGYHDFELAVSPVSTSVSVWSYKDATYGTAATGPQLIVTNGGEAGVAGTTITSTGGTGAWAAMTATFTPTSAGIVTVRLQSNATVGTANVYFDDFAVA